MSYDYTVTVQLLRLKVKLHVFRTELNCMGIICMGEGVCRERTIVTKEWTTLRCYSRFHNVYDSVVSHHCHPHS